MYSLIALEHSSVSDRQGLFINDVVFLQFLNLMHVLQGFFALGQGSGVALTLCWIRFHGSMKPNSFLSQLQVCKFM